MVNIIGTKSINSIRNIVKSNGRLKNNGNRADGRNDKTLFSKFNKRLDHEGFKEMKISSLYKYLKSALEFLGVSLLELRAFADRTASDIENGKKRYAPDFCSFDDCFDVCSFMEDS